MVKKKSRSIIKNTKRSDSSSKLIFGDDILSSQFFRDYGDLEILRHVQPEDIEDVSERYVPLFSTERESDTVKKVNISRYLPSEKNRNELNLPLYIISLIEHKTKVEYNVGMQILRYMIYIWEDYEKEMAKQHPGISGRKNFRYPPILPIVYYEGNEKWTAPMDISERILCGEVLERYLPHFQYQLVRLQDYSNQELLEKRDEISLAMLINKIQCPEDMTAFVNIPGEQMNEILKDTPEYLLDVMAKLLRALLYSMNLPENETETVVSRIKEKKMARLFENVKMDIQAERRKAEKAQREAEERVKKAQQEAKREAKREVKREVQREVQRARQEAQREARREAQLEAQREVEEAKKEFEIYRYIIKMEQKCCAESEIKKSLLQKFSLTEGQAEEKYRKAHEEE